MDNSFKLGLALGLTGKPLPMPEPQPVAYLYNSVRLPALPKWNKETHPYAVIFQGGELSGRTNTNLYFMQDLNTVVKNHTSSGSEKRNYIQYRAGDIEYHVNHEGAFDSWGEPEILSEALAFGFRSTIWTNTDLVALIDELGVSTGEVFLAASDPVPAYE